MALPYDVKAKITSEPKLKPSRHKNEIQYHLHFNVLVDGTKWDVAVNVGTNDADDLLKYKFAFDFRHSVIQTLAAAEAGSRTDRPDRTPCAGFHAQRSARQYRQVARQRCDGRFRVPGARGVTEALALEGAAAKFRRLCVRTVFQRRRRYPRHPHESRIDQGLHSSSATTTTITTTSGRTAPLSSTSASRNGRLTSPRSISELVPTDELGNPKPGAATI